MTSRSSRWVGTQTSTGQVEDVIIDGSARPTVEIVVDLDTLAPGSLHLDGDRPVPGVLAEYLDMSPLPAETARRICCETRPSQTGPALRPVSNTMRGARCRGRTATNLAEREEQPATAPSPDDRRIHPRICEAHHIVHWALHGETELENLVLLCWHHHHLIHEGGWTVQMHEETERPMFEAPDGRQFPATPPRPQLPRQTAARLKPDERDRNDVLLGKS